MFGCWRVTLGNSTTHKSVLYSKFTQMPICLSRVKPWFSSWESPLSLGDHTFSEALIKQHPHHQKGCYPAIQQNLPASRSSFLTQRDASLCRVKEILRQQIGWVRWAFFGTVNQQKGMKRRGECRICRMNMIFTSFFICDVGGENFTLLVVWQYTVPCFEFQSNPWLEGKGVFSSSRAGFEAKFGQCHRNIYDEVTLVVSYYSIVHSGHGEILHETNKWVTHSEKERLEPKNHEKWKRKVISQTSNIWLQNGSICQGLIHKKNPDPMESERNDIFGKNVEQLRSNDILHPQQQTFWTQKWRFGKDDISLKKGAIRSGSSRFRENQRYIKP